MNHILHDLDNRSRSRRALQRFFIFQRPHENRGMIAVAADFAGQFADWFGVGSKPAVFFQHQHPHLVARVEQFRRWLVVRAPIRVRPHLLQSLDSEILQPVRQRLADSGHVLMIGHALNFHMLPVDENAVGRINRNGSHPKRRLVKVRDGVLIAHRRDELVKIRRLRRPQVRWKRHGLRRCQIPPRRNVQRRRGAGHHLAGGVINS